MILNLKLLDATIRNQVYLEQLKAGQVGRFTKFLKSVNDDLKRRLTQDDLTEYSRTRFNRLLSNVNKNLDDAFKGFQQQLELDLVDVGEYEAQFEARSLENAINQAGFESVVPSPNQVKAAIFSQPLSVRGADGGKLLKPFVADWTKADKARVIGAIRQGYFEGQTNFQILKNLQGTKARKYQDGVLGVVGRNGEAIIRTSVQHVASVSRFETWEQNKSVVKGYEWRSTLDSRTSTICRTLDGETYQIGHGPKPPAHIRCRSTTIASLDKKYDFLDEGRTRYAKGGNVDANQDYYDWLKDQTEEFQDDVLGPVRGKLFRDGGLGAERFRDLQLDKRFRPITLDEMRKKEPDAFKLAFGGTVTPKTAVKPKVTKPKVNDGGFESTPAGKWHSRAFIGSRKGARKVALENQDVEVLKETGGAWARGGQFINMGSYSLSKRYDQDVWRHEFGHIIDVRRSGSVQGYASSRSEYREALKKDGDEFKIGKGVGKHKNAIKRVKARKETALKNRGKLVDMTASEKVSFNKKLAMKAGLEYDKFVEMVDFLTGSTKHDDLSGAYRIATLIDSIRFKDVETFYRYALFKHSDGPNKVYKTSKIDGHLGSLCDLVGASTRNVVCPSGAFPGHPTSYYAERSTAAPTETFANLMAAYGHPNTYVWDVVSKLAPNMSKLFLEIINEQ